MEPTKRYELIAYVDDQIVGKTSSNDVDDVIASASALEQVVDLKVDQMIEEFAWPLYQEVLHESD